MISILKSVMPKTYYVWLRDHFYQTLPRNLREDYLDLALGRRTREIPPLRLMFDGVQDYDDFRRNGLAFLKLYIDLCGLQPDESILDVGSGIGRKTIPLMSYLNTNGEYWGLDLSWVGVDWCRKTISRKNPIFHFQVIDVYNKFYNPTGTVQASEYVFPFPNNRFDFIVLGSVFTHMLPNDVRQYLSEIARVLKPGKRCLITYYLLTRDPSSANRGVWRFSQPCDGFFPANAAIPEEAVAYEEDFILDLYRQNGLHVRQPVRYGYLNGRGGQDVIIADKVETLS